MRRPPEWLLAFNVFGFILLILLMGMYLIMSSETYKARRNRQEALSAMKKLQMVDFPESAKVSDVSSITQNSVTWTHITFEAPPGDIWIWIKRNEALIKPYDNASADAKTRALKYHLAPASISDNYGIITVDGQAGRVDMSIRT